MKIRYSFFIAITLFFSAIFITSCGIKPSKNSYTKGQYDKPLVPDFHKNATIYEVNLRHYTAENTFKSFEAHLPRLKNMGVDILWFMPIHPIALKNRKGGLGSPYSIADYYKTNPDYGTLEDFKHMVQAIHQAQMHIIIDWVPNHTGWDHPWITQHPDWYQKDKNGNITDPIDYNTGESWGWTDVAALDYKNPKMRLGMIDAMRFWVNETGIDGFRMDVAHAVPEDFWIQCTDSLYNIKPLFMLSEGENPNIVNNGAFVADYAWEMHHTLNEIAAYQGANRIENANMVQGNLKEGTKKIVKKTALDIDLVLAKKASQYQKGYQMQFTSNHDENSWADTEFARMGNGHKAFAVLCATFNGFPLIYSGQEAAMDKKLEFFEKDFIPWDNYTYAGFYKTLFDLKHRNQALWNGTYGGNLVKIPTKNDENVYAFTREKNGDKVIVIINLSATLQKAEIPAIPGQYNEVFTQTQKKFVANEFFLLQPWQFLVYSNK
ncbi:MAG: alpha amylase C-terminal domain-containing protein [Bacteroidia bacterium]|nr:alpha amylase C-terminal domain-containing protein [Chitinophagales bacterium]MCZ2129001.1 alpha amylase C-terminal domain-containing protein [Bacteroidia bacterium]